MGSEAPPAGGAGSDALLTDTIVAIATAPGLGAVALVRMSGPQARTILRELSHDEEENWSPRTARVVKLREGSGGALLDEALVTIFTAPDSYTGEDIVEISTHGGYLTPALVVQACIRLGARQAEAGEFTRRAYLNGKLDLTQAEAVADLIHGLAPRSREVALHQLERGLADRIGELRDHLIGLSALLVQHLDFPEEDDAPTPLQEIGGRASDLVSKLEALLHTAPAGELLREGAVAVLAGRPNSGKSSLFNALLGTERAIVTEEAGTTRDALEAVVSCDGFPFRLVDTAGLRDDRTMRAEAGRVERMGIEVAVRYLHEADVVLYCLPVDTAMDLEEESFLGTLEGPVVLVRTKDDVRDKPVPCSFDAAREVRVSAQSGSGLGDLQETLAGLVFEGVVENRNEMPVVTRARHVRWLEVARGEIQDFALALKDGVPPEAASAHLKTAESALEEILGVVALDDVLDRVFRDFCIGK